jgi:hypothetical protein
MTPLYERGVKRGADVTLPRSQWLGERQIPPRSYPGGGRMRERGLKEKQNTQNRASMNSRGDAH